MKSVLFYLILLASYLPPGLAKAAEETSRFIKCEGASCSACNLVEMANELIVWLFGIIFLLFAILMTVAGFGLVTSGGNPSALNAAKDKFTNAMIGLLIVMSAWLIVDTIMKSLVKGGGEVEGWGPWSEVKCQVQTKPITPAVTPGGGGATATTTASSSCPIAPLTPITDPEALRMEAGERVIFTNPTLEACVNKFIGLVGGTVTSAYRPQSYQSHLYEVSTKACELHRITNPACATVKAEVEAERVEHQLPLCGTVAQSASRHGTGIGVDISGPAHGSARVNAAADASCLKWRNYRNDPVHYDLDLSIPGCSCN